MARDDAEIISKIIASGNPEGYLILFRHYSIAVEEVVSRVWDLELSDQKAAVEEAFAQVFSSLDKLREPGRFAEYLFGTAYDAALRRRASTSADGGEQEGKIGFASAPLVVDVSTIRIPCPLTEVAVCIREAVETLPESDRQMAMDCLFGQRMRPQILAAARNVELAAVGRAVSSAFLRAKIFLLARIAEGSGSHFPAPHAAFLGEATAAASSQNSGEAMHLTDENYAAILNGERPAGFGRPFAEHLKNGCPLCEEQIRRRSERADVLDAIIWTAIFSDAPFRVRGNIPMFRRIVRRLRLDARFFGKKEAGAFQAAWFRDDRLPMTLAAILGIMGLLMFSISTLPAARERSFWERTGESSPPEIRIAAIFFPEDEDGSVGGKAASDGTEKNSEDSDDGEEDERRWLSPGQQLTEDDQIAINYVISRSRFTAVLRIRPDGEPELLDMPGRLPPGTHSLSIDGIPSRMILKDAEGLNRFVVVTADRPLDALIIGDSLNRVQNLDDAAGSITSSPAAEGETSSIDASWFDLEVLKMPSKLTDTL